MKPQYYGKRKASIGITSGQIATIKMAQSQLCISDEDYRDMLEMRYKVRSCKDLTFNQAGHFISELQMKGFRLLVKDRSTPLTDRDKGGKYSAPTNPRHSRAKNPDPDAKRITPRVDTPRVAYIVTPEQIDKVNAVAKLVSWRLENGLTLFLEKRMGLKDGKIKTSSQFHKAIEGLKAMYENQMKAAYGENWWLRQFEDDGIMTYIAEHCPKEFKK